MTDALNDEQKTIMLACQAAASIMTARGIDPEEIANGMLAYGGAIALELVGPQATADIFRSKADGLVDVVQ